MKIGYPCINRSIGCTANSTFRLASYSKERLISTVEHNLSCLKKILEFNVKHNLLFFRISSDLVPFASHPVCTYPWQDHFKDDFRNIGNYIKKHKLRISMHPDQFVLINAKDKEIIRKSISELDYHCNILNLMHIDKTAKVQIHVGGVYNDKPNSIKRFIENYISLPKKIKDRLCIENDHKLYSFKDCYDIHKITKIPIIFDTFHHECLNNNEPLLKSMTLASKTWKPKDGLLMVDYSSQKPDSRIGTHVEHINLPKFKKFIGLTKNLNFDIMLEIKDKEKSALEAVRLISDN